NIRTTGSPVTITGLSNGVTYNFTVIATNKVGNSTPSNTIQVTPTIVYNNIHTSYRGNGIIGVSTGVLLNQSKRISYNPLPGYYVDSVIINGVTQSKSIVNDVLQADSATGYTFYNMQADSSIQVVFSPIFYTIFTAINIGGIITNNTQVIQGNNVQIKYTIDSNYSFSYALINGSTIEKDSTQSYTFSNVQQNNRILVNNSIKTYNVNTQINNGSISVPVYADKGSNLNITYLPNSGYYIDSIFVNNEFIGNRKSIFANNFTFINIQKDQQIRVSCKPNSVPDSPTLTNVLIFNNSANVFFNNSFSDNGNDILFYTVSTLVGNITASGTSSPINITGLNPNNAYQFYVTATNSLGVSKRSNISQSYTTRIPISFIEQLDSIGKSANYPANGQYNLLNNVDFTNANSYITNFIDSNFITGAGFKPIENFTGKFFGNGFSISNLYINRPSTNDIALFKSIQDTVQGIRLLKVKITGNYSVGSLVAKLGQNGKVIDCYTTGVIFGADTIGGLVGNGKKGNIVNSVAKTNIQGSYRIGGIIGYSDSMQIENSYSTGVKNAAVNYVGGIAGLARKSKIIHCYSLDSIYI
ncbi:MAG: fibronectin type III domain-containing protein, partial [Sediminibacterium sp.]|nr:fibronectin type III domain-containing protein [Sediminibacterium sp.]